jgi:hypothetical protein
MSSGMSMAIFTTVSLWILYCWKASAHKRRRGCQAARCSRKASTQQPPATDAPPRCVGPPTTATSTRCDCCSPTTPPLEAENEFGNTVLDQTIWSVMNEGFHPDDHLPLIEMLLAAGAKVPTWWLRADRDPPLPPQVAAALI